MTVRCAVHREHARSRDVGYVHVIVHFAAIAFDDGRLAAPHLIADLRDEYGVDGACMLALAINGREAQRIEFEAEAACVARAQTLSQKLARAVQERGRLQSRAHVSGFLPDGILDGRAVDGHRRREHHATNPIEAAGLEGVHHPDRVDRQPGERILRHRQREVAGEREYALYILRRLQKLRQSQDIAPNAPNARLALQMRDRRRCTQGVIVQEANLLSPLGKQLIGNVRTDEARTSREQIDTLCQMDLLTQPP